MTNGYEYVAEGDRGGGGQPRLPAKPGRSPLADHEISA